MNELVLVVSSPNHPLSLSLYLCLSPTQASFYTTTYTSMDADKGTKKKTDRNVSKVGETNPLKASNEGESHPSNESRERERERKAFSEFEFVVSTISTVNVSPAFADPDFLVTTYTQSVRICTLRKRRKSRLIVDMFENILAFRIFFRLKTHEDGLE